MLAVYSTFLKVKPRRLQVNGKTITWEQFKEAYNWDQSNYSLPVHERLSEQHFELDPAAKMRMTISQKMSLTERCFF